jgi:site-specific recombinase XerD
VVALERAWKFESSSPHITEPAPTAGFRFLKAFGAKYGAMGKKYKKPTLYTGKKWYVQYYYLIPDDLRPKYNNKLWQRFKVYEDINRIKTREYAITLRDAVEYALSSGYNPFEDEQMEMKAEKKGITLPKEYTIIQALNLFKTRWADRGLVAESLQKYYSAVERFSSWLKAAGFLHIPAKDITGAHVEAAIGHYRKKNAWSNRMYNNEITFLSTAFNFMRRQRIIAFSPFDNISKLKTKSKKHRYYDAKILPVVKEAMLKYDKHLYFAAECVYGMCLRSEKELMSLMVGNIYPERKQVYITPEGSKTNGRYIPITDEMIEQFKVRGILDMPPGWYVFGKLGAPGADRCGKRWFATLFAEVRRTLQLDKAYTLYGMKHTKVIHMKKDGAADDQIMAVTGHTDFSSYAKYLRDLGIDVDIEEIQKKSRAW